MASNADDSNTSAARSLAPTHLGFGRVRRPNGMPDPHGTSDPSSAAFSPLVTDDVTQVRPVRVDVTQPDTFPVQGSGTSGWWTDTYRGVSKYVNQTVGGEAGQANTLGWSTGLRPRKESRTPLTGRVLTMPSMAVHPVIGQVGRDNRANRLYAAVASQNSDYQPNSASEVAAMFVGGASSKNRVQLD